MRHLEAVHPSANPLALERQLSRHLEELGLRDKRALRLSVQDRRLIIDGFVSDLSWKLSVEKACKSLAPGYVIVNRLRVAVSEDSTAG